MKELLIISIFIGINMSNSVITTDCTSFNKAITVSQEKEVTFYSQKNEMWANKYYPSNNIENSGCGPTTMAMVLDTIPCNKDEFDINKDSFITPDEMASWSIDNNCFVPEGGSYQYLIDDSLNEAGITFTRTDDYELVLESLKEGKIVVENVDKNNIINSGKHFVLLTEIDDMNKVKVYDPKKTSVDLTLSFDIKDLASISMGFWIIENDYK